MRDFREGFGPGCPDPPFRAVRAHEMRIFRFQRRVLASQGIVIRIADRRCIRPVIGGVVQGDLGGQPFQFRGGLGVGRREVTRDELGDLDRRSGETLRRLRASVPVIATIVADTEQTREAIIMAGTDQLLARDELRQLPLRRIDPDAIVDRLDVNAILDRIDVDRIVDRIRAEQAAGWQVCLIATERALHWFDSEEVVALTGHPIQSRMRIYPEPLFAPLGTAMVVAPAGFNAINKIALGLADGGAARRDCRNEDT